MNETHGTPCEVHPFWHMFYGKCPFCKQECPEVETFKAYEAIVGPLAKGHDDHDALPTYAALGLGGETGEVLELIKKAARGDVPLDDATLALEMGDVLWYLHRMAAKRGFTLGDVATLNTVKLTRRKEKGKNSVEEHTLATRFLRR